MTSYSPISNAEVDPESPITSSLISRLRDNPLAIQEGDPSAPDIVNAALGNNSVDRRVLNQDDWPISFAVNGLGSDGSMSFVSSVTCNWLWLDDMPTDSIQTRSWVTPFSFGLYFAIAGISMQGTIGDNIQRNSDMIVMATSLTQVTVRHEGLPGSGNANGWVVAFGA